MPYNPLFDRRAVSLESTGGGREMAKGTRATATRRRSLDIPDRPKMPDVCWVKFPAVKTAGSMRVTFESLAAQLAHQPSTREVREVLLDDGIIRVELDKEAGSKHEAV